MKGVGICEASAQNYIEFKVKTIYEGKHYLEFMFYHILAHFEPIKRVRYHQQLAWMEEFLALWEPETCTLGESLEQYRLGIDIT